MPIRILRRVRAMFNSELVPPHINRANQRKWVLAVRQLGERWVYATHHRRTH